MNSPHEGAESIRSIVGGSAEEHSSRELSYQPRYSDFPGSSTTCGEPCGSDVTSFPPVAPCSAQGDVLLAVPVAQSSAPCSQRGVLDARVENSCGSEQDESIVCRSNNWSGESRSTPSVNGDHCSDACGTGGNTDDHYHDDPFLETCAGDLPSAFSPPASSATHDDDREKVSAQQELSSSGRSWLPSHLRLPHDEETRRMVSSLMLHGGETKSIAKTSDENGRPSVDARVQLEPSENATRPPQAKPRTQYNIFLERLKHPTCATVVASVKQFVERFPTNLSRQEASQLIHPFLSEKQEELMRAKVFAEAAQSPAEQQQVMEGLERFVLQKLHAILFTSTIEDENADALLEHKIKCLQWVELAHFEIPDLPNASALDLGARELERLDRMKCPRDKLVLILNCCRVIIAVLDAARRVAGSSQPPAADDLLPLLIYSIIKSRHQRLHSNIQFISFYRHPSRLVSEEAYFFTHFCSAVAFIKSLGQPGVQLHIDPLEYSDRMQKAASQLQISQEGKKMNATAILREQASSSALAAAASALSTLEQLSQTKSAAEATAVTEVRACAAFPTTSEDVAPGKSRTFLRQKKLQEQQVQLLLSQLSRAPCSFTSTTSISEVRVGELSQLLLEYHEALELLNKAKVLLQQQVKLDRELQDLCGDAS